LIFSSITYSVIPTPALLDRFIGILRNTDTSTTMNGFPNRPSGKAPASQSDADIEAQMKEEAARRAMMVVVPFARPVLRPVAYCV
jgi:hypothetical protein